MKLHLACGAQYWEGWVNIDVNRDVKADIYRDITRGLPYGDGVADEIVGEHIVEHLDADDFIFFFNEAHRVLKEGGLLRVNVPYFTGKWAYIDPTHKRLICENSFDFFMNRDYNSVTAGVTGWFEPVRFELKNFELIAVFKKVLNPTVMWAISIKKNSEKVEVVKNES